MRVIWFFVLSGKVKLIGALLNILYSLLCKDKGMLYVLSVVTELVLWVAIGVYTFHNTNFTHPFLSLLGAIAVMLVGLIISFFVIWKDLMGTDNANHAGQKEED